MTTIGGKPVASSSTVAASVTDKKATAWLEDAELRSVGTRGWDVSVVRFNSKDMKVRSELQFLRWEGPQFRRDGIWVIDVEGPALEESPERLLQPEELRVLETKLLDLAKLRGQPDLGRAAAQTHAELAALGLAKVDGPPPASRDWSTLVPIETVTTRAGQSNGSRGGGFDGFQLKAMLGADPVVLSVSIPGDRTPATIERWNPNPSSSDVRQPAVQLSADETTALLKALSSHKPDGALERVVTLANLAQEGADDNFDTARPAAKPRVALDGGGNTTRPPPPAKDPITGQ